ncbi:MAG: HipA domain-containing protein [Sarcina sp.]
MQGYKNFSSWNLYDGFYFGSGTSLQEWIINPVNGKVGLFKERKSDITTDNFSEKIAMEIADMLNFPAARIDLALREERVGVVSYRINSEFEELKEGIQYISDKFPEYNRDTLIDEKTGEYYSLEIILEAIKGLNLEKDLFKVFIFDFLIGNRDRHHGNWAIIEKEDTIRISPVYDNASSLCAYLTDSKINSCFNDDNWFKSVVDRKSVSLVRLQGKKVTHLEFITYLMENYYTETIDFVKSIREKYSEEQIESLVESYKILLSEEKVKLLKKYLKEKFKLLFKVYKLNY